MQITKAHLSPVKVISYPSNHPYAFISQHQLNSKFSSINAQKQSAPQMSKCPENKRKQFLTHNTRNKNTNCTGPYQRGAHGIRGKRRWKSETEKQRAAAQLAQWLGDHHYLWGLRGSVNRKGSWRHCALEDSGCCQVWTEKMSLFTIPPRRSNRPPEHTFAYIVGPRSHSLVPSSPAETMSLVACAPQEKFTFTCLR